MKNACGWMICSAVAAFGVTEAARAQHVHEGDLVVGQVGGQLAVEFDFDECIGLPPVDPGNPFGLLGWLGDEPGFDHADGSDPDLGALSPGASIYLVGVSLDPALKALDSTSFAVAVAGPGDQYLLGDDEVHEHAIWQIDAGDAGFNPLTTKWYGTFKLVDLGTTGYAESAPFTLSFMPVPEPSTMLLLAISGLPLLRRRRGV